MVSAEFVIVLLILALVGGFAYLFATGQIGPNKRRRQARGNRGDQVFDSNTAFGDLNDMKSRGRKKKVQVSKQPKAKVAPKSEEEQKKKKKGAKKEAARRKKGGDGNVVTVANIGADDTSSRDNSKPKAIKTKAPRSVNKWQEAAEAEKPVVEKKKKEPKFEPKKEWKPKPQPLTDEEKAKREEEKKAREEERKKRQEEAETRRNRKVCYHCGREGHITKNCPIAEKERENNQARKQKREEERERANKERAERAAAKAARNEKQGKAAAPSESAEASTEPPAVEVDTADATE